MTHKKKYKNFHVFELLNVIFGGLEASSLLQLESLHGGLRIK
jgi:hypothetical protein